jgi:TolB-like protein
LKALIGGRPLPLAQALRLAIEIGEGLKAAHDAGVVHRDIKSGNVMVTSAGQAKLMDFGLAHDRGFGDATRASVAGGTPGYMAPEQAEGAAVDERADIWSAGAVLHEMLTGRVPSIGQLDPLPAALEPIVRKALAAKPSQRYQHMADMLVDLRRAQRAPAPGVSRRTMIAAGSSAAVLAGVGGWYLLGGRGKIESLAVLPLENLSGNPEEEYFSDGITDELIGEIARIGSLRVISRTSMMRYKKTRKPLPEIARELNVDAVVEGTVRQAGGRVRVTAKLIRARDEQHLWSENYERDTADVFQLQGEIARTIARQIRVQLTSQQEARLSRARRVQPEAQEAYLRGNYFLHRGIPGIPKSLELFRQAVQHDPEFAEAHAGMGEALIYMGIFGFQPSAAAFPQARMAAEKALQLDSSSAAAVNVLADVKKGYDWDLKAAEELYLRALAINPNHLLTRLWYAESLARMGRTEESLAESHRATALDPVSALSRGNIAMLSWRARRYDDAIRYSRQSLEIDPLRLNALWWQSLAHAGKGEFREGVDCLMRAVKIADGPIVRGALGFIYGRAGDRAKAHETLKVLDGMAKQRYVTPVEFATVYAGLGDADAMFSWLEKAFQARSGRIHDIRNPCYDAFRQDPRHADLMKRTGLAG